VYHRRQTQTNPEWKVGTGRPSWHQARAGHRDAGLMGFSSKIQALRYMARFKRHHPHEPMRLIPPSQRKANPMRRARRRNRTAAQRAATRRMIAGLHRWQRSHNPRRRFRNARKVKHPGVGRGNYPRPKKKRHLYAAQAVPEGAALRGLAVLNPRRRRNRKRRRNPMARRRHRRNRRRRNVAMANPRRRRNRRRRHARRPNRRHYAARRRNRRHYGRRRNPGIRAALKTVFASAVPAIGAGAVAGFLDAKFLADKGKLMRIGARVVQAAVWGFMFRSKPVAAYSAMGAVLGTIGTDLGIKFSGSAYAPIAALIQENPSAMGVLVNAMQGMGLQLDTGVSLGDAGTALDSGLPANSYTDVNLG